eukprot:10701541-Heterocapsa_arctica.AAC.1
MAACCRRNENQVCHRFPELCSQGCYDHGALFAKNSAHGITGECSAEEEEAGDSASSCMLSEGMKPCCWGAPVALRSVMTLSSVMS